MDEITCAGQSARGYYRMDRTFARTGQSLLSFTATANHGLARTRAYAGDNVDGVYGVPAPRVAPAHRVGAPCKTKANVTYIPESGKVGGCARRESALANEAASLGAPVFVSEYTSEFGRADNAAGMGEPRPFVRRSPPAEETEPGAVVSFATTVAPAWTATNRFASTGSLDLRDHICTYHPRSAKLWPDYTPPGAGK